MYNKRYFEMQCRMAYTLHRTCSYVNLGPPSGVVLIAITSDSRLIMQKDGNVFNRVLHGYLLPPQRQKQSDGEKGESPWEAGMLTILVRTIVNTNNSTLAKSIADTNTHSSEKYCPYQYFCNNTFYCFYIQQRSIFPRSSINS